MTEQIALVALFFSISRASAKQGDRTLAILLLLNGFGWLVLASKEALT